MDHTQILAGYIKRVEDGIIQLVPPATTRPSRLHQAMLYSLQAGGKRLRPVLVLATADLIADCRLAIAESDKPSIANRQSPIANPTAALPAAVAIECIHTYSLIHDDLPCMDDDDLRRGRPTVHKAFDEATAVLAGDALLTLAFQLIARHYAAAPSLAAALTGEIADAAGSEKLIGGQMEDLLAEKKSGVTPAELEFIHLNKTAAMITVSLVAGGLCAGADEAMVVTLREAGRNIGLAFQIIDDLLDATADTKTLGKTAGKDAKAGKATFVALHGLQRSREFADAHSEAAVAALKKLPGNAEFLVALVRDMQRRGK